MIHREKKYVSRKKSFIEFINTTQQLKIPIYQRKYSWDKKQCDQLFKDIEEVGQTGTDTHFMGSIVYQKTEIPMRNLTIIDGQQRITTLSLLIGALAKFLIQTPENEENIEITGKNMVNLYLLNNGYHGDDKYELLLTDDDNSTYRKIIDNILDEEEFSFTEEDKKSRLYKTFEFFSLFINQDNYLHIWNGLRQLILVGIQLDNEFPQAIFESLNSKGKNLDSADLIRNFLLMNLTPEEQKHIYDTYWHEVESIFEDSNESFDVFIKYYLNVKYKDAVGGNIYDAFKDFTTDFKNKINGDEEGEITFEIIEKLVKDVYKYWNYYIKIVFGKETNPRLNKAFKTLNLLPYTIVRPLMLDLYDDYKKDKLGLEEFVEIIDFTESYMFRRSICNLDSQSLKGFFSKMYTKLNKEEYLESYKYILNTKTGKSNMPKDDIFEKCFKEEDVFHSNIKLYVFLKLIHHISGEIVHLDECTIEHIMPQSADSSEEWHEELGLDKWERVYNTYLDTIGNLTLIESIINSKLGNKLFKEKRDIGYDNSSIILNHYFKDNNIEHWTETEIEDRRDYLYEQAKEIWKYPIVSDETKQKYAKKTKEPTLDDFIQRPPENNNLRYWKECKLTIDRDYEEFHSRTPTTTNKYVLSIGTSSAQIELTINSYNNEVKCILRVYEDELFMYLFEQEDEIRSQFEEQLSWDSFSRSHIIAVITTFDLEKEWDWDEYIRWQLETAKKLNDIFNSKLEEYQNEER